MSNSSEYPAGRTRPAQAPPASAAAASAVPSPPTMADPESISDPAALRAKAPTASPAAAVTFADPATVAALSPAIPAQVETSSAEERALLSVLRLIDRNLACGALTPSSEQ